MTVDEFKNQLAALNSEMTIEDMQEQMLALHRRAEMWRQRAETAEITFTLLRQALDAGLQVRLMPSGPDYAVEIIGDDKEIGPYVQGFSVESIFTDALYSALQQLTRYFRQ